MDSTQPESSSPPNKYSDAEHIELQETEEYTSHDARFAGKTLEQKKILIIEREINIQGMGKYQRWIWVLCGLGYFLDLLWAQAIGLITVPLQNEYGFSDDDISNLFAVWSGGLTVGALLFGFLVDQIGRYWAFNLTVLISSVFGTALGGADSYNTVLALAFFNGLGIGGNIPIDTTICLEFLPEHRRDLLPLLSIFQPLGVILTTLLAYAYIPRQSCLKKYGDIPSCVNNILSPPDCIPSCFNVEPGDRCCEMRDNKGWRKLMYTLGGISLGVFIGRFIVFSFQESPKYLLVKQKDASAVNVIQYIAKFNKKPTNLSIEQFHELDRISDSEDGVRLEATSGKWIKLRNFGKRYGKLFSKKRRYLVTVVLLIYAFDYWGFSITGALLPLILERKNGKLGLSTEATYRDYVAIYTPGVVGVLLGAVMYHVPGQGRQVGMIISASGYCAALFGFIGMKNHAGYVGINVMEYFFQSMFNSILYSWTPEAFPSDIRGTASGAASASGRLFSTFMPIAASHVLEKYGENAPLILAGSGVAALVVCVCILPPKAFKPEQLRGQ